MTSPCHILDMLHQRLVTWKCETNPETWHVLFQRMKRLHRLINKNIDDICNVLSKPGGKIADRSLDKCKQVSLLAWENWKFHHLLLNTDGGVIDFMMKIQG